jgi:hypothetical protein
LSGYLPKWVGNGLSETTLPHYGHIGPVPDNPFRHPLGIHSRKKSPPYILTSLGRNLAHECSDEFGSFGIYVNKYKARCFCKLPLVSISPHLKLILPSFLHEEGDPSCSSRYLETPVRPIYNMLLQCFVSRHPIK